MPNFKYVIIRGGGGIAGATAAETIHTKDADGAIAIVQPTSRTRSIRA